jgi:hypothetical protein
MGTNPIGKGTKNVSVNMPEDLQRSLAKLAEASGVTLSAYIKAVLAEAALDGARIKTKIDRDPPPKSSSNVAGTKET